MDNLMRKNIISPVYPKAGYRFAEHNHRTGKMYTWEVVEVVGRVRNIKALGRHGKMNRSTNTWEYDVRAKLHREEWYDQYISRTTNWGKKKYPYEAMGNKELENARYMALKENDMEKVAEIEKHMNPYTLNHLKGIPQPKESALKTWLTFFRIIIFGK